MKPRAIEERAGGVKTKTTCVTFAFHPLKHGKYGLWDPSEKYFET